MDNKKDFLNNKKDLQKRLNDEQERKLRDLQNPDLPVEEVKPAQTREPVRTPVKEYKREPERKPEPPKEEDPFDDKDYNQINSYVKEFLKFNDYNSTLDCFQAEERTRVVTSKSLKVLLNKWPKSIRDLQDFPNLYRFFDSNSVKSAREAKMEQQEELTKRKYQDLLTSARIVFSQAVDMVKQLETVGKDMDSTKVQLGRHHQILLHDINKEKQEYVSESIILQHKQKIYQERGNDQETANVLVSLRVNGLKAATKENYNQDLVRHDILFTKDNTQLVEGILGGNVVEAKQALGGLLSMIVASKTGLDYAQAFDTLAKRCYDTLREQEDDSAAQRFYLFILQRFTLIEANQQTFVDNDVISFITKLLERSLRTPMSNFIHNMSSGILLNVLKTVPDCLNTVPHIGQALVGVLLSIIKESMPDKTIYNFMQSLKILKPNEEFFEGMNLKDRVKDFEVYYKKKYSQGGDELVQATINLGTELQGLPIDSAVQVVLKNEKPGPLEFIYFVDE